MTTREEDIKRGIENPQGFASYWTIIAFEELRKTLHALWMARAERAKLLVQLDMDGHWDYIVSQETQGKTPKAELDRWFAGWDYAERKCREKAKEFE